MVDSGSLVIQFKPLMERDANSSSAALFEFMYIHGSYLEFMSMESDSVTSNVIQQIVTEFSRPTKPVINTTILTGNFSSIYFNTAILFGTKDT